MITKYTLSMKTHQLVYNLTQWQQEAAALAASQFAFVIQSSHRGVHFTVTPGHPVAPAQEAVWDVINNLSRPESFLCGKLTVTKVTVFIMSLYLGFHSHCHLCCWCNYSEFESQAPRGSLSLLYHSPLAKYCFVSSCLFAVSSLQFVSTVCQRCGR